MKCFYHHDIDAVGICKNCNRGVCNECAKEMENGIACKDRCEDEVRYLDEIMNRTKSAYKGTSNAYVKNAIIYLLIGCIFVATGILERTMRLFVLPLGLIFLLGSIFSYSSGRKFVK